MSVSSLNGYFYEPKPHRIDFIKENKRKLKQISSFVSQEKKFTAFNSATAIRPSMSQGSPRKSLHKTTGTGVRVHKRGNMAVFLQNKEDEVSNNVSNKILSRSGRPISKNQSSQTIDPKKFDELFFEGKIMYPSERIKQEITEIEKKKLNRLDSHIKKEFLKKHGLLKEKNVLLTPDMTAKIKGIEEVRGKELEEGRQKEPKQEKEKETKVVENQVMEEMLTAAQAFIPKASPRTPLNAAEIIRKSTEEHNTFGCKSGVKKLEPNVKAKKLRETVKTQMEEVVKLQCPPGHVPLSEAERKKTLQMLRTSHAGLVRELNMLPVRADTLRIRQKKIHIETQLNKIEEGIKVFTKSKVFVKIEE